MKKQKKILFIVSRLPINTETGDQLRVYHFIRKLSQRGYKIDLIGFVPAQNFTIKSDIKKICNHCIGIKKEGLEFRSPSRLKQLKTFFSSFLHGYPYRVWQWNDEKFARQVRRLLNDNDYSVVHFSEISMGIFFKKIKEELADKRVIFDLYDSMALALRNSLKHDWSFAWPFRFIDFLRLKRFEKHIIQQVDKAIFISERDKQFLGFNDVAVIPNGISKNKLKERPRDIDLLFVGNMVFEPNIDAARWFAKDIMPILLKKHVQLHFYIVGTNPVESIKKLENKNVTVTGYVQNINAYYRRAKFFVCPMRLGAGQKNKILEAMINYAPVISTTEGNIGIDAPSTAIAIADNEQIFADRIITLMANKNKRNQLAENAFKFVSNTFSWEKSATLLEQHYRI